jgi:branched-chain amino acid transport system substrate-binding protein
VQDVTHALDLVRSGQKIKFVGAGASCDFNARGDQLNRSFLHQVIENGHNKIVDVIT